MKQLLFALLLVPALVHGQTKFSQLPTATPDGNTSVIGLKNSSGIYSDYLFTLNSLAAYIGSVNPMYITTLNATSPVTVNVTTGNANIGLSNSGVTAGSYGSYSVIPGYTVNAQGLITGVTTYTVPTNSPPTLQQVITNGDTAAGIMYLIEYPFYTMVAPGEVDVRDSVHDNGTNISPNFMDFYSNGSVCWVVPDSPYTNSTFRIPAITNSVTGTYGSATVIPGITVNDGIITGITYYTVAPAATPTLQNVTDAGNTTTDNMIINGTGGFEVYSGYNTAYATAGSVSASNSSTNIAVSLLSSTEVTNPSITFLKSGWTGILQLPAISTSDIWSLPDASGTVALTYQLGNISHIIGQTSTPTIAAGTGAGTSPAISISGTDLSGYITLTTGTSPVDSAVVATVTFNTPYSSAPKYVAISPANAKALSAAYIYSPVPGDTNGSTTTTFTIVTYATLTASSTYKFRYSVSQ